MVLKGGEKLGESGSESSHSPLGYELLKAHSTDELRASGLSRLPAGSLWMPQRSPKVFYSLSQCAVCLACIFCSSMIK